MTETDAEWAAKLHAKQRAEEAARLATAKAEAHRSGKQPFDFKEFQRYVRVYEIRDEDGLDEDCIADLEWSYYITYPNLKTVKEFAAKKDENDVYDGG